MTQNAQIETLERQKVIAVHGSASTGAQWRQLVSQLADDYDVSAPDLPGYGKSRNITAFSRPSLYGDAIEIARVAFQSRKPVHLVAHSYGAAVALKYALESPREVASLTLIEPALFHLLRSGRSEDMHHYTEISVISNAVRKACFNGTPKRGMAEFVDYWNGVGTWQAMDTYLQATLAGLTCQVARNFAAALAEDWSPSFCQRITCPTLVVKAQNSRAPAMRVADIVADAIPNARMTTIADAGHMVPVTHPHLVNPMIAETLAEAASSEPKASYREAA